ncbi:MAG: transcriptional regulator [Firmicutes bacterium HGW-Firmicutes-7]|nr:MAG: transcriptional regulator [Firmicutes bacterium HGW-Firmicutes-7]
MYVNNRMVTDVITVFPDASLSLAFQMMVEKGFSQLPVVKDKKLLGMITEQVLTQFSPSKATTLSVYELNYVLSKTTCQDIMIKAKDMVTCPPDMLIEDAAVLFNEKNIDSLLVVNHEGHLEGILTKSDIIAAFIEIVGTNDFGTRIAIEAKDELGTLADISSTIKDFHVNITHVTNYYYNTDPSNGEIIIRLNTLDVDDLVKHLESKGYRIISIKKNE